jgi:hypothetical protein
MLYEIIKYYIVFYYLNYNLNLGILSKHILLKKDNILEFKIDNSIPEARKLIGFN